MPIAEEPIYVMGFYVPVKNGVVDIYRKRMEMIIIRLSKINQIQTDRQTFHVFSLMQIVDLFSVCVGTYVRM